MFESEYKENKRLVVNVFRLTEVKSCELCRSDILFVHDK